MALTEKQKQNLFLLDSDTLIELMHECAEILGVCSVDEYCKIKYKKRRTVYDNIKNNKVKYIKIANNKYPVLNNY